MHAFPFDSHQMTVKLFFNDCYNVHRSNDMPSGAFGTLTNNEWKILPAIGEEIETMAGESGKAYIYYK